MPWLVLVLVLSMFPFDALACRRACASRETRDARGCCVRPATPTARWSSNPSAYLLTASSDPVPGDRAASMWGAFLGADWSLVRAARRCQRATKKAECLGGLTKLRARRVASLEVGEVAWGEASKRPGLGAERFLYYQAIAAMTLGRQAQAVDRLRALLAAHPRSPYAAHALATLGDLFYAQRQPALALPLYVRAAQRGHVLAAYASYMSGWCHASLGDAASALKSMHLGLQGLRGRPELEPLHAIVLEDLATVYAALGAPQAALEFFSTVAPGRLDALEHLSHAYEARGALGHAMRVRRVLAKRHARPEIKLTHQLEVVRLWVVSGDALGVVWSNDLDLALTLWGEMKGAPAGVRAHARARLEAIVVPGVLEASAQALRAKEPARSRRVLEVLDGWLRVCPEASGAVRLAGADLASALGLWERAGRGYREASGRGADEARAAQGMEVVCARAPRVTGCSGRGR